MDNISNKNGLISRYKLSKEEHEKIYEIIKKMIFNNIKSVEKPTAIIVGAQPGSGKGSLIGYSKEMFEDKNNIVIITTDDYKPFHPKASEIAKKYPTKYSAIVEADSADWTNKILHHAIDNKFNFIFEVTLRNERILRKIQLLKEQGFSVIVRGLAVPYLESLITSYERYEEQIQARNWGRFFDVDKYNRTYQNIPNTIEAIENSKYCDALEIYVRGKIISQPQIIYGTYSKDYKKVFIKEDTSFIYETAKEAIIEGRNTSLDASIIKKRMDDIENSMKRRNITEEEMIGLQKLKNIITNYF